MPPKSGHIRVESAKAKDTTLDMGERSLVSMGGSRGVSLPSVMLENEDVELGEVLQCHYDPETGAVMFVPGDSDE